MIVFRVIKTLTVCVTVLVGSWVQPARAESTHQLIVVTRSASDAPTNQPPVAATVLLRADTTGQQAPVVEYRREILVPGEARFSVEPGTWSLEVIAPGRWSPRIHSHFRSDVESTTVQLDVWDVTSVSGVLSPADGVTPPAVDIDFSPPRGSRDEHPRGSVVCPVAPKGAFQCDLPVASVDLRIGARNHVPHYRFGVDLSAEGRELGRVPIRLGASLSGWIACEGRSELPKDLLVGTTPSLREQMEPLPRLSGKTAHRVQKNGFFQIAPIQPGRYVVYSQSEQFAAASSFAQVIENRESVLRSELLLDAPTPFEVIVSPAVDLLGEPWRLRVGRIAPGSSAIASMKEFDVQASGVWESKEFPPGKYYLGVRSKNDGRSFSTKVELGTEPMPVLLELEDVALRGKVFLGKKPLAAEIFFGGKVGGERVMATSDSRGGFEVFLPRSGKWLVEIEGIGSDVHGKLKGVNVEAPSGSGVATVTLRLPDTGFEGRVVDETGRPVPGAIVSAAPAIGPESMNVLVQERAGEDGEFRLRGLPEGSVFVDAFAADHDSGGKFMLRAKRRFLTLEEGNDPAPITMTVRKEGVVQGQVVGPAGPIPNAKVSIRPLGGVDQIVMDQYTDGDGFFETGVPPESPLVGVTVMALGYALKAWQNTATGDGPATYAVSDLAGTVIVVRGTTDEDQVTSYEAMFFEGVEVPWYVLEEWSVVQRAVSDEGEHLVLPSVAVGEWSLCRVEIRSGRERSTTRCDRAVVSTGTTVTLEVK